MRSDNDAVSTVADALGLGGATVDVTYTAINNAIQSVSDIKSKLVAARAPGLDRSKIQSEITALQSGLKSTAESAVFSGENWLMGDSTGTTTKTIVSSFSRDSTGEITIGTIGVDVGPTGSMLFDLSGGNAGLLDQERTTTSGSSFSVFNLDISALTDSDADLADLEDMIKGVDDALAQMTDAATVIGSAKSRIQLQKDFVTTLMQSIDTGIGQLVDADMNEESTRLQALQVRQQLGVQALNIANQSAQMILQLFQGQ
jgi:flagellin